MDSKTVVRGTASTSVTDGSQCHFPFRYRGQDFTTCTTYGSTFLWCATTDHYERDGQFAICDPFRCPPGWRRHERLCYYFSSALDKRSWTGAEQACEDMGSELGYIGSSAVESFITDNINEYFWIGLNDQRREGSYSWDHRPNMIMVRGFTNWGIKEPRNGFGTEDCVEIVNGPYADDRPGEWVMEVCAEPRRYVCMKDAENTLEPTTTLPPVTIPVITSAPKTSPGGIVTPPSITTNTTGVSNSNGGLAGTVQPQYQSSMSPSSASLQTGEIISIVIACLALVLAAVFIFLYIRKTRQGGSDDMALKSIGFESASYSRSHDSVNVGLENPGFSATS